MRLPWALRGHNRELEAAARRDAEHAQEATRLRGTAEQHSYASGMMLAADLRRADEFVRLSDALARQLPAGGREDRREFAWHYLASQARRLEALPGYHRDVETLRFTPSGLWTFGAGEAKCLLGGRAGTTRVAPILHAIDARWSANDATLLRSDCPDFGSFDVYLWDARSGGMRSFRLPRQAAHRPYAALSPDGSRFAYVRGDDTACLSAVVVDAATGTRAEFVNPSFPIINALAFTPDGEGFAWTGPTISGGTRVECRRRDGSIRFAVETPTAAAATRLVFSPDGTRFVINHLESAELWEVAGPKLLHRWDAPSNAESSDRNAGFSPDGRHFAAAIGRVVGSKNVPEGVRVWDTVTGEIAAEWKSDVVVWALDLDAEGTIALGTHDDRVRLWRPFLDVSPARRPAHAPAEAWAVAHSPAGDWRATAGDDHAVRLWTPGGEPLGTLEGHSSLVSCLAASPDGTLLASGGYDDRVIVWDVAARRARHDLRGATHDVRCVAFSRDGRVVAAGGRDRLVRLWDAATGESLGELDGHDDQVRAVAFLPSGDLLSACEGGKVIRWSDSTRLKVAEWLSPSPVWCLAAAGGPWPRG